MCARAPVTTRINGYAPNPYLAAPLDRACGQYRHPGLSRSLKHIEGALHHDLEAQARALLAFAPMQCSLVEHVVSSMNERVHDVRVADVGTGQVSDDHIRLGRAQRLHQMRADEARSSGDHNTLALEVHLRRTSLAGTPATTE